MIVAARVRHHRASLLAVIDNDFVAHALRTTLAAHYEVTIATSGARLQHEDFDLVLCETELAQTLPVRPPNTSNLIIFRSSEVHEVVKGARAIASEFERSVQSGVGTDMDITCEEPLYSDRMQTVGGRYALDGRLGEGGMGQVYRARHLQLGKAFALKIISPAFAGDHVARTRFNQEAKLASEISHPNIVSVVDFGEDEQFGAYMVMELVEGEPLITPGVLPMSVKRAIDVLGQVADALDHIHKRGIIHGDVKADNIMLTAEQQRDSTGGARRRRIVRLLDFGLARRHEHGEEEGLSGSPHYLAPERAAGGPASVSSDVYALGVLGYLLLTGTLPFEGTVMEVLMAQIHNAAEAISARRKEELDPALESLIVRSMAKDPATRHGSAAAFRYELNTVMDMLDMGRRRPRSSGTLPTENARETSITQAFERSRIPQAILSLDGHFVTCNRAFNKLVNQDEKGCDGLSLNDTTLTQFVPGLMRALRSVHVDGKPIERRAKVFRGTDRPPYELTIWLTPLPIPGEEIHMLVRVEEIDMRREVER